MDISTCYKRIFVKVNQIVCRVGKINVKVILKKENESLICNMDEIASLKYFQYNIRTMLDGNPSMHTKVISRTRDVTDGQFYLLLDLIALKAFHFQSPILGNKVQMLYNFISIIIHE